MKINKIFLSTIGVCCIVLFGIGFVFNLDSTYVEAGEIEVIYNDSIKVYDSKLQKITIRDKDVNNIAKYTLTDYGNSVVNCWAEGEYTLYKKTHLFTGVFYKDIIGNLGDLNNIKFHIWENKSETRYNSIYENQNCVSKISKNGTIEVCDSVLISNKSYEVDLSGWINYEVGTELEGNGRWKLEAERESNKPVDFILEAHNQEFEEWAWWNSSWGYKRPIGNLTGNISTFNLSFSDFTSLQADFDDLRFTKSDDATELNYTIREKVNSDWALVTVNNLGDSTITVWYDNDDVTTTGSASNVYFEPVSAYYLDKGNFNDSVNSYDFTNFGTSEIAGIINNGKHFDTANSDYIFGSSSPSITGDWSIQAWVYRDGANNDNFVNVAEIGSYSGTNGFGIWSNIGGDIDWRTQKDINHYSTDGTVNVGTGAWTHIIITYDGSNIRIYKNGAIGKTSAFTTNPIADTGEVRLGNRENHNAMWNGKIDEVKIYDKALTLSEVKKLYTENEPIITLGAEEQITIYCTFSGFVKDEGGTALVGANVTIWNQYNISESYENTTIAGGSWKMNIENSTNTYMVGAYYNNTLIGQLKPYISGTC